MKKTLLYIAGLQLVLSIFAFQVYKNVKELREKEIQRNKELQMEQIKESTQEPTYQGIQT